MLLPARARERRLRFERRGETTGWTVDDWSEWLGEEDGMAVAALLVVSRVGRGESAGWSSVGRGSAITAYVRIGKRRQSGRELEEQDIHKSKLIYRNFLMRKGQITGSGEDKERRVVGGGGVKE